MKLAKYNATPSHLTHKDINLVIKDANDTIEKNSNQIWALHQNLNSIVETLENELCDYK
jgi:hypothetical protein